MKETNFRIDVNVEVPGHDGTPLATNIWRPGNDVPAPALLVRTPYGKDDVGFLVQCMSADLSALLNEGYAIAFQSCRGTFGSGGEFIPHINEALDGAAAVRWLTDQPWCDGNVGGFGPSYLGMTQLATASTAVEGFKAIVPVLTAGDYYRGMWYSPGGALSLSLTLSWSAYMATNAIMRKIDQDGGDPTEVYPVAAFMDDLTNAYQRTPVIDQPVLEPHLPWFREALSHPSCDAYWRAMSPLEQVDQMTTPALHIGGWYDLFVNEVLHAYQTMRQRAGSPEARAGQRLIVGPWGHTAAVNMQAKNPDRRFGMSGAPVVPSTGTAQINFLDRWLRGRADALDGQAPVRLFVMGLDQWRDEQEWPLPDTRYTDYYLSSTTGANTARGDGLLSVIPAQVARNDTYLYDPRRPVPTLGGTIMPFDDDVFAGPVDQRPIETRDDVLCFTTPELDRPIEVTGHVSLTLFIDSSAVDTDFTGKLVDVFPDGRAIIICDGILRARYRNSLEEPQLLTPGAITELTIDLGPTSNVFLPGHRIRLEVSSSNFPRYDRNSNTGGVISHERLEDMVPAVNRIHHGPAHASRLTLPLIER